MISPTKIIVNKKARPLEGWAVADESGAADARWAPSLMGGRVDGALIYYFLRLKVISLLLSRDGRANTAGSSNTQASIGAAISDNSSISLSDCMNQ